MLCFRMACDLIPNFDIEKKRRGRPRKGSKMSDSSVVEIPKIGTPKLVLLIQNIIAERNISIIDACKYLKKQKGDYYAEYRYSSPKVLETRFHELAHLYDHETRKVRCPGCSTLVGLEYFPQILSG